MYTAARIFIIIAIIANALAVFILPTIEIPTDIFYAIREDIKFTLLMCIVGIVVGIVALKKMGDGFEKPSIAISIITLILCSPIAGIIMLCIPETKKHIKTKTGVSAPTILQCTKCGKHDSSVQYFTVNTALGKMNRPYCPECRATVDSEDQKK